jgi:sugar phosphate isomerase/epimerase
MVSKRFRINLSLHIPFTNKLSYLILLIGDANIAYLKRCVSVAHELNTTHIITHSGYCVGFEHWKKRAIAILVTNFEDIIKDCERY